MSKSYVRKKNIPKKSKKISKKINKPDKKNKQPSKTKSVKKIQNKKPKKKSKKKMISVISDLVKESNEQKMKNNLSNDIEKYIKNKSNSIILDNSNNYFNICSKYSDKVIKPSDKYKVINYIKQYYMKKCNAGDLYDIYFTSGINESNNIAISSIINGYKSIRKTIPHVIVSSHENDSTILYLKSLKNSNNIDLTFINPNLQGCIISSNLEPFIKPNTCCAIISHINNEFGSVNNIENISKILHAKKIPLISDYSNIFGFHKVDLIKSGTDCATIEFTNFPCISCIIIKKDLVNGYKLYEQSDLLNGKENNNVILTSASMDIIKNSYENREEKNKKILHYRNMILSNFNLIPYIDYHKSDEPPLSGNGNNGSKILLFGPRPSNEAYYTPRILTFSIIDNDKSVSDIKKLLESDNIIIGLPENKHIYESLNIDSNIVNNTIRLTISNDISENDIKKFINKLSSII